MEGILTTAQITCKSSAARQTVLQAFQKIINFTQEHEPEVLQYVCALPIDDTLGTEIYVIEEYANQASSDAHLTIQPVKKLIDLFSASDVLAAPPQVHNCRVVRRDMPHLYTSATSNPVIALAHFDVESNKMSEKWESIDVDVLKGFVVSDNEETKDVRVEFVFDNWAEYQKVKKSGELWNDVGGSGKVLEIVEMEAVAGFVGRDGKSRL